MAGIDSVVADNFAPLGIGVEGGMQIIVNELDGLIYKAGKLAEAIQDHALLPLDDIDNDTISSIALGLIALLGQTAPYMDALEHISFNSDRQSSAKH